MPIRVLFFVETPHRFAGSQKALLEMLRPIRSYAIDPLVVFPAEGITVDAYRAAGLDVRVVPAPPRLLIFERGLLRLSPVEKLDVALRDILPYAARIARLARRERVELAHFNQVRGLLSAGPLLFTLNLPVVLHLHGMPNLGSLVALRLAATYARRIVLCADAIRPALDPWLRARTRTVHNGLAPTTVTDRAEARAALAAALGLESAQLEGTDVILTLSTRTAFKGLHHLASAVATLRRRSRPLIWGMLGAEGEDSYVRYLDAELRRLGLDDGTARVLGFRSDATTLLAGADLLVLPTVERETLDDGTGPREVVLTEGLPMAVLEALAAGIPVVATDVAGVREQLDDGSTGRLVGPSDPDALASAIAEVLDDPAMRARVRELGPRVVRERFGVDRSSAALARVLREAHEGA